MKQRQKAEDVPTGMPQAVSPKGAAAVPQSDTAHHDGMVLAFCITK